MKTKSSYVFNAAVAAAALAGISGAVDKALGAPLAQFTFEANSGSLPSGAGSATSVTTSASVVYGPLAAESGIGSAFGFHVSTTGYSTPAGNGSTHSFSSNDWTVGDYYQFNVPATSIQNLVLTFAQISSSTGPSQFQLQYSVDGTSFSSFSGYTIPFLTFSGTATTTGGGTITTTGSSGFSAANSNSNFVFSFDLSAVTALNGNSNAAFRLVDNGTQALNGGGAVAAGGTDRVDDFAVSGTAVPEPASLSLISLAGVSALRRRRQT